MRERLATALLALLLCASPAWAEPPLPAAPTPAVPAQEEAVDETAVEDEEGGTEKEEPWVPGYQEVRGQPMNLSEGDLKATLLNGALRPSRGYVPLEVTLHNPGPTPRLVRLGFESTGMGRSSATSRDVEVGPRQRLVAWLPVPVSARGGLVSLRSPDVGFRAFNFYSVDSTGAAVLVLGSERAFQAGTSLPRVEKEPKLSVRFVALEDAPRELAAYVGHGMVVVAGDVTALPADAWTALESYAATGGHLTLLHPPRDVAMRLPLLSGTPQGEVTYGFGQVRLCAKAAECGQGLLADVSTLEPGDGGHVGLVTPAGPPPSWQRGGRQMLNNGEQPLLPGVQAPVGRFLLLITLFVLAVGPGGLALARRKGPVALLIAVPSVALVTCLAIVGWSVLVEGFSVHAARYTLTWLDRERDRAVTVGLSGYYANLAPEGVRVPAMGALLGPDSDWESPGVEADWTNGMAVTGGFLPSRTYREWGEVAVVPTRARLTVQREGEGLRVRNALGAPLAQGYVRLGGALWTLPVLADGAEGMATLVPNSSTNSDWPEFVSFPEPVRRRFNIVPRNVLCRGFEEGDFLVRLEGPGLVPTAALPVELHEAVHFMRGRVDGP